MFKIGQKLRGLDDPNPYYVTNKYCVVEVINSYGAGADIRVKVLEDNRPVREEDKTGAEYNVLAKYFKKLGGSNDGF